MKKTASKARDEKLLAAVRDRPVLYDQSMHVFKDYGAKNAAWKEVGSAVVGSQDKQNVERLKVRWKTLRDGFVRHLKKKKTMEMYTAAAAMRPYKLEKQIAFLLPHVSFRDEDDNGSSNGDEDNTSSLLMAADIKPAIECEPSAYDQQQTAAEMLYEQSNMDKSCSEHEALDRSIHFLCDQRYKQAAATNYKLEDMDSVDAFFHAMAQTVKQLKPITVAKIKRAVSIIVSNAEIEEMETTVACGKFPMTVPITNEPKK
ncbi:uncharacterized protein LOC100162917 [Acyrthosiphon pisum]|uniref:MADF domain-containing protein n=1 Tax=Acyrthosiphon pisum TaxID=7029 RepID=A0A8R2AAN9_ACYPI|nr:uncharacterized protein LOC100162917 [Acyrthosiphon pisum]|eukprot:XP_001949308.1 PREDICTED: uncharacterized protein LOC100162917 [Acyrthosiphon pisum]